jgi:hypothetical protein
MKRFILLVLVVSLTACIDLTKPAAAPFAGSRPMNSIPKEYAIYWFEIERCSGLHRIMDMKFYQIDSIHFGPDKNGIAYYQPDADRITYGSMALHVPGVIRHEMLHAHGIHEHDPIYREKCGDLIYGW